MHTTGLRLALFSLATSGFAGTFEPAGEPWWMRFGIAGMAIVALIYVYNDQRKSSIKNTADIKELMLDHKNDRRDLMDKSALTNAATARVAADAAVHVAQVAAEVTAKSSELARENMLVLHEVKEVIRDNTKAMSWCRDSALARMKTSG